MATQEMDLKTSGNDTLPGTTGLEEQEYEVKHRALARRAAADGMVLLKNEDEGLPLAPDASIALYGAGALGTIKGGTGSGDVNCRETVNVWQGLKNAGFQIVNEDWIEAYRKHYQTARENWRDEIWQDVDARKAQGEVDPVFVSYTSHPFDLPAGDLPQPVKADVAVYVIARIAGEAKDRELRQGDYLLSEEEHEALRLLCEQQERVIVVINSGGLIDLSFIDEFSQIKGLIYMGQPGMEAGNALADVLSGAVTPSGHLTDSWAYHYEDYPNAQTFSHRSGDVSKEYYNEGIYVGYRYFDTFEVPVRYGFGYGLSYTTFALRMVNVSFIRYDTRHTALRLVVEVTNTGTRPGREVVQIYASCPQKNMTKEYRRLVGFAKSDELLPGKSQDVEIFASIQMLASYSTKAPGWLLDCGTYGLFMGDSLQNAQFAASVELTRNILLKKTGNICPLQEPLEELECPQESVLKRRAEWHARVYRHPAIVVPTQMLFTRRSVHYGKEAQRVDPRVMQKVETLSEEQLISLVTGDPGFAQGGGILGAAGSSVPGSAAQTSDCAVEQGIPRLVLADGPAGLRLTKKYYAVDGRPQLLPVEASMEDGYLYRPTQPVQGEAHYQFCTAFPAGMQLAQSWDVDLLTAVGEAVAEEMRLFSVDLWLAPGMNIHRNPLCGRNFEYYSEDPLLSGKFAAAITAGVQKQGDLGTTIKHFACNNQEDNRTGSDSIVSERALREIYLTGFEIAVREALPKAIMTSYNLINGVHAANNYDLCTSVVRDEWRYKGVIMTDWATTLQGDDCTAAGCMRAGNDLVMPGVTGDHENLKEELAAGTLTLQQLRLAVAHLIAVSGCDLS